jgi:hypothetical protein
MSTTRVVLTPESAHFPDSAYAGLGRSAFQARPVLLFDAGATEEEAWWTFVAPQGLAGALSAVISYYMASATSGTVAWDVYVEAVSAGDAQDLDANATPGWDTVNTSGGVTVPGTAGYLDQISVTLTNADTVAAGDLVRVRLVRDTSTDTATGDAAVLSVEIREA